MPNPSTVLNYIALGREQYRQGNMAKAAAFFRLAVTEDPDCAEAHARLAWAIADKQGTAEAIEHLRIAARLAPGEAKVRESLGILLKRTGELDEAIESFEAAIAIVPDAATPLCELVNCKRIGPEDEPLVRRLEAMAVQAGRPVRELQAIQYALGKARDNLGQYREAMSHFDEANRLGETIVRTEGKAYREESHRDHATAMIRLFGKDQIEKLVPFGSDSDLPLLIVGMIRSGTTLLDQILSSHPKIGSAGELMFWPERANTQFVDAVLLRNLPAARQEEFCQEYRRMLRVAAPGKRRVIDKMPMNYMSMGLIHVLFPRAKFIHMRRNPIDTCLSIYTTEFGNSAPDFAFGRHKIVSAYRQYQRLMEHWKAVLPAESMIEVDYEELVEDRKTVVARILEFLDLEWDDACLSHERNEGVVNTPSAWQARQPVYRSSLERWRKYEPWLGEFLSLAE